MSTLEFLEVGDRVMVNETMAGTVIYFTADGWVGVNIDGENSAWNPKTPRVDEWQPVQLRKQ